MQLANRWRRCVCVCMRACVVCVWFVCVVCLLVGCPLASYNVLVLLPASSTSQGCGRRRRSSVVAVIAKRQPTASRLIASEWCSI